jgi:hypothetical protein
MQITSSRASERGSRKQLTQIATGRRASRTRPGPLHIVEMAEDPHERLLGQLLSNGPRADHRVRDAHHRCPQHRIRSLERHRHRRQHVRAPSAHTPHDQRATRDVSHRRTKCLLSEPRQAKRPRTQTHPASRHRPAQPCPAPPTVGHAKAARRWRRYDPKPPVDPPRSTAHSRTPRGRSPPRSQAATAGVHDPLGGVSGPDPSPPGCHSPTVASAQTGWPRSEASPRAGPDSTCS